MAESTEQCEPFVRCCSRGARIGLRKNRKTGKSIHVRKTVRRSTKDVFSIWKAVTRAHTRLRLCGAPRECGYAIFILPLRISRRILLAPHRRTRSYPPRSALKTFGRFSPARNSRNERDSRSFPFRRYVGASAYRLVAYASVGTPGDSDPGAGPPRIRIRTR